MTVCRPLRRALNGCLRVLATVALAACTSQAAQRPSIVPLPKDTLDLAALGMDRYAILESHGNRRAVAVVLRDSHSVQSGFDVADDAAGVAALGVDRVLVLRPGAERSVLETYALTGMKLSSITIDGRAREIAGATGDLAYVLVRRGNGATIEARNVETGRITGTIVAPPGSDSASARTENQETSYVVSDKAGALHERVAADTRWQRLLAKGTSPAYATSGNAIYAIQRINGNAVVAVIERPYGLQVRLFPVSRGVSRLASAPDGSLIVLDRESTASAAQIIACRSPLLAVGANVGKHGKFNDLDLWNDRPVASSLNHTPNPSDGC